MEEAKIYYQEDCNLSMLEGKTIAVIGYGSQGHAHALNAKESGCHVIIGLYEGSKSWAKAEAQGFEVYTAAEAAKKADIIMILINDEKQAALYKKDIEPNLEEGNMLMFAHGFMYRTTCKCRCYHDRTERTWTHSKKRISGGQGCSLSGSCSSECYRQSSGDRTGLCTGNRWSKSRCSGDNIQNMRYSISNTAEYGDYITGPKIITEDTKKAMKKILSDIQDGTFAKDFLLDMSSAGSQVHFKAMRKLASEHPSEKVGAEIRKLYSWNGEDKLINN